MRGRFLLFAAMALLTFLAPAQAALPGSELLDPCLDLGMLFTHPEDALLLLDHCTLPVKVDFTDKGAVITVFEPDGDLVITIVNDLTPGGDGLLVKVEKNGALILIVGTCLASIVGSDGNPDFHVGPFYPGVDVIDGDPPCAN